jgi:hypothetical protein
MLINCAEAAKRMFNMKSLAIFQEVNFSHPDLPGISPITGRVDFLSATLVQNIPLAKLPSIAAPSKPLFVVVEAKKTDTMNSVRFNAQLLAQLLTADYDYE